MSVCVTYSDILRYVAIPGIHKTANIPKYDSVVAFVFASLKFREWRKKTA